MTAIVLAGAGVACVTLASHAFHSWLKQRERERLSAIDKAELSKRLDDLESKLREVKNLAQNAPRRG